MFVNDVSTLSNCIFFIYFYGNSDFIPLGFIFVLSAFQYKIYSSHIYQKYSIMKYLSQSFRQRPTLSLQNNDLWWFKFITLGFEWIVEFVVKGG